MAGKFECYEDKAGEFRFRLKAGNGEVILKSEGYGSRSGLNKGIESVRKNSRITGRFDMESTDSGKFRFNLKSSNGQVIGTSQNYDSESGCRHGMKSVSRTAADARVVEVT